MPSLRTKKKVEHKLRGQFSKRARKTPTVVRKRKKRRAKIDALRKPFVDTIQGRKNPYKSVDRYIRDIGAIYPTETPRKTDLKPAEVEDTPTRVWRHNLKSALMLDDNAAASGYQSDGVKPSRKRKRYVSQTPFKMLDAPNIACDLGLNVLDWNQKNHCISIALSNKVYIWNSESRQIQLLCESPTHTITSIRWINGGTHICVATDDSRVVLWDTTKKTPVRSFRKIKNPVGAMSWNSQFISTGDSSGEVLNHDSRISDSCINNFKHHTAHICSMEWDWNGNFLATGSSDNTVAIWKCYNETFEVSPRQVLPHNGFVRGLAWCPWDFSILVTGSVSSEDNLRVWKINGASNVGQRIERPKVNEDVTGIVWNPFAKEMLVAQGGNSSYCAIYRYPSMKKTFQMESNEGYILSSVIASKDQATVATASADERLRFWRAFEPLPKEKKSKKSEDTFRKFRY